MLFRKDKRIFPHSPVFRISGSPGELVFGTVLSQQPIEQSDLGQANCDNHAPGKGVPQTQTTLTGFSQPKLKLRGAELNQVAIAQYGVRYLLAIHADQGIRLGPERKTNLGKEIHQKVLVPNSRFFKLQIGI